MNREVFARAFGSLKRSGSIWTGLLVLFAGSVIVLWPSMSGSGSLDTMMDGLSPELLVAFGLEDYGSAVGFLNGNLYAVFLPALLAVMAITHTNSLTAGDEDSGRLELLMVLPVSRTLIYLSRFAAVATWLAIASMAVGLVVGLGGLAVDMSLNGTGVAAITLALFLFALTHAAVVFAIAGIGWRAPLASGIAFGVLGLGYILHALLPLAGSTGIAKISLWHWALSTEPLTSGFDGAGTGIMVGCAVVLAVVGIASLNRRTIRSS